MLKFRLSSAILSIFIFTFAVAQNSPYKKETKQGKEYYIYTVSAKDGMYSISKIFNVSHADILKYNPDLQQGIKTGQKI